MDYIVSKHVKVLVNIEGSLRELAASLQHRMYRFRRTPLCVLFAGELGREATSESRVA